MVHGAFTDSAAWFNRSDEAEDSLPVRLCKLGYDVFIANLRGSEWSKTHADAAITDEDYWDFDIDEIAANDIPTFVSTILAKRAENGLPCQKVNILGHSFGAAASLLTAAKYPFTASKYINAINPVAPCMLPEQSRLVEAGLPDARRMRNLSDVDIAMDGSERVGRALRKDRSRNLSHSSNKSPKSLKRFKSPSPQKCWKDWDREAYNAAMRDVRNDLGYRTEEYAAFYSGFKDWRRTFDNKNEWKCDGVWEDKLLDMKCEIQACNEDCQPLDEFVWGQFINLLGELGINSMYGPEWSTEITGDLALICDALPVDSDICSYLTSLEVGYPAGTQETSVKQLDLFAQQAFTGTFAQHNELFAADGFCVEPVQYDLSTINVPVFAMFTDGDSTCDNSSNLGILYDNVGPLIQETTWTDGRSHASLSGSNDEVFFNSLAGQL